MPEVSRFYGIVIRMYLRGEHPPPHFHVQFGEHRASVSIEGAEVIEGHLPVRAAKLVREESFTSRNYAIIGAGLRRTKRFCRSNR